MLQYKREIDFTKNMFWSHISKYVIKDAIAQTLKKQGKLTWKSTWKRKN